MNSMEASRRFYEEQVKNLIHEQFGQYEDRIAVGIAGEGSDCFGYDDFMSRDHDFGTGVCLWITEEDLNLFGRRLSIAYNELIDGIPGNNLSERLRERRGVMTINDFYSNVLGTRIDAEGFVLAGREPEGERKAEAFFGDREWQLLDHSCLATAVNGEVFRDDLGIFSAFRNKLLDYYPDHVWRIRIANALHQYASSMQVNYARSMKRRDFVAARLCQAKGIESAMELFFLMKREYPPYYKWTYQRMAQLDHNGRFSRFVEYFARIRCDKDVWELSWKDIPYQSVQPILGDPMVAAAEEIASMICEMLRENGLTEGTDPYLERYVEEVLAGR
ncbi:MAG: DUF4037 domain-containing protein [Lachnospiraceae bacterium]|nr:DUF4037 domain-containing protein [Lachnospiraceae bacterium]